MFAFAIWDAREQALFLARDPLGIKPLYYADDGKTFRFASQVKALAAAGAIPSEPSAAGLVGFYIWGHVPEPWTWLAAVKALPAGCTLTVRRGGPVPSPRRYFDLREEIVRAESSLVPEEDVVEAALEAVSDSVRHHLVADVPVGVFLSSGRDSRLVAVLAARHADEPLRTITLGFDEFRDTPNDEVPGAEAVARLLAAQHRTVRITQRDFDEERDRLLAAMDQPSIDGVNTYFVSRAAAQAGLKVALSGLGGDELFGGYASFAEVPQMVARLRCLAGAPGLGRSLRWVADPVLRRLGRPKWAGLLEYGTSLSRACLLRRALIMPWELSRFLEPDVVRQGLAELALEDDLEERIRGIRNPQAAVMALEMSGYMRNQLLRDADWTGMAHSLEIRVPLVDVVLLRRWLPVAVRRLPLDRQRLLEAAAPSLADVLRTRPKSGFGIPVHRWVRAVGPASRADVGLRPWARMVAERFFGTGRRCA